MRVLPSLIVVCYCSHLFVPLRRNVAKVLRLDKKKKRVSLFCAQLFVPLSYRS